MKGIFYIATVVSAYRKAIDYFYEHGAKGQGYMALAERIYRAELLPLKNRKYTADFIGRSVAKKEKERAEHLFEEMPDYIHKFIAVLIKRGGYKNKVLVFLKNKCACGDILFFKSCTQSSSEPLKVINVFNEKRKESDFGRAGNKVYLEFENKDLPDLFENGIFFKHESIKGNR